MFNASVGGFAVLFLWFLIAPLDAQQLPLFAGDTVRVSAQGCGLDGDTAVFEAQRDGALVFESISCAESSITRLEVHRGKKRHWLLGAGVGLLVGAGAGAALFASSGGVESCTGACWAAVGAIYGAGPGVLLGAGVGALIRTDRWRQLPVHRLSVGLKPQPLRRFGIGIVTVF